MDQYRILVTYCGQGGSAKGYADAGFEIVGVDLVPQPLFPFEFHQGDAIEFIQAHGHEFDAIDGGPPCQVNSPLRHRTKREYPRLIGPTRDAMRATGKPYVIENVEGAAHEMIDPVTLCGSHFGLGADGLLLKRHRLFETSFELSPPSTPDNCRGVPMANVHGGGGQREYRNADGKRVGHGNKFSAEHSRIAMGTPWMTAKGMNQAIPPVYTEFVGRQLMAHLAAS